MSKRGKKYTADFKTKMILKLLESKKALNQICSKHEVTPKTVKEKEVNELHRQLGKRTAELEWASKKLKSLGYSDHNKGHLDDQSIV